jgi:hypothetical protein
MTSMPRLRRRVRLSEPIRNAAASSPLLQRFHERLRHVDRAGDAADSSDESLQRYESLLAAEAELCAVPADLLRAICWYASGWRQYEPSGRTLATPEAHGTRWGCMQLSDHWHPDAFPSAMSDPRANVRYAANLLNWLQEQTGSWRRATVAFFGHDARAEQAARRVQRYREDRPWLARLPRTAPPDAAEGSTSTPDASPTHPGDELDDLYADLAL